MIVDSQIVAVEDKNLPQVTRVISHLHQGLVADGGPGPEAGRRDAGRRGSPEPNRQGHFGLSGKIEVLRGR